MYIIRTWERYNWFVVGLGTVWLGLGT